MLSRSCHTEQPPGICTRLASKHATEASAIFGLRCCSQNLPFIHLQAKQKEPESHNPFRVYGSGSKAQAQWQYSLRCCSVGRRGKDPLPKLVGPTVPVFACGTWGRSAIFDLSPFYHTSPFFAILISRISLDFQVNIHYPKPEISVFS